MKRYGAAPEKARGFCVAVHGRGQTADDMIADVLDHIDLSDLHVVLPEAPGKSWYKARAVDPMQPATLQELIRSLDHLALTVAAAREACPPGIPKIMFGFSQGACLVIEHALRSGPWNGALLAFTGCRVGQARDDLTAVGLDGLPVYVTGRSADPWITPRALGECVEALGGAGARVRAESEPGSEHEITEHEIAMLQRVIANVISGREAFAPRSDSAA